MMQHESTNMDKKLRQLEAQSLPDLTSMDEHWQEMKTALRPQVVPARPNLFKGPMKWIIAACMVIGSFLLIFNLKKPASLALIKKPVIVSTPPAAEKSLPVNPLTDTIKSLSPGNSAYQASSTVRKHRNAGRANVVDYIADLTDTTNTSDTIAPEKNFWTLESFFKQLEKSSQEFVINNQKDTMIQGADGTALLIPAKTFNSPTVTIVMREYYSYQDIISNKLSTLSDDRQLVTGGMLHLTALIDGKETDILPGKSIKWFIPDTTTDLSQMELFNGVIRQSNFKQAAIPGMDTAATSSYDGINWIPQNRPFRNEAKVSVKVLDIRDRPLRIRTTLNRRRQVGVFRIDNDPKIGEEELKKILKEKYNYSKVRIIKRTRRSSMFRWLNIANRDWSNAVGDSAWIPLSEAKEYKLTASDTVLTPAIDIMNKVLKEYSGEFYKRFRVDVSTLGWINCDRFYRTDIPKVNYAVDLQTKASDYFTILVFDQIKSMMTGSTSGNKVLFLNIPKGITAKLICVGIRNGLPITATENVIISEAGLQGLKFEQTTPDAFKEEAGSMDVANKQ
jgi:hypothetical protein